MLFLLVRLIVSLLILNRYAESYKVLVSRRSSLQLASSKSGNPRPEFLREINENKVLREKLADDEDSIGNYKEAERLARDAMLLADHSKQVNNIYSAYATGILADALYAEGKYKNAAESYKEALEAYKRHYRSDTGPETVELMGALQLISWVLLTKRDYDEAQIACANALGITEKLLGPKDLDVASSMVNLATAYVNKGDLGSEPEILLNKALNIYNQKSNDIIDKAQFTEEMKNIHFLTGSVEVSLGSLFYLRGDDDSALQHYNQVIKMFDNGEYNYPEAVQALKNAALILWTRNNTHESERLLGKALFKLETSEKFGNDHKRTVHVRNLLHNLREGKEAPAKQKTVRKP